MVVEEDCLLHGKRLWTTTTLTTLDDDDFDDFDVNDDRKRDDDGWFEISKSWSIIIIVVVGAF